jgi:hypothetical protein
VITLLVLAHGLVRSLAEGREEVRALAAEARDGPAAVLLEPSAASSDVERGLLSPAAATARDRHAKTSALVLRRLRAQDVRGAWRVDRGEGLDAGVGARITAAYSLLSGTRS